MLFGGSFDCLAACGFFHESAEGHAVSLCGAGLYRTIIDTEDWWKDPPPAYSGQSEKVFVGYFLACIIGITLGILMGCSKTGKAIVKPIFELLRPIPGLAWIPLAILWFGIGETSKYFIICVSAIVSIILNAYAGASQVDQTLVGAARMLGAKPAQIFLYITLPASVPQIFAGLQVGLSSSWMAVIAAEMIRANEGAGWIITTGMESGNTVQILAGMISIGLVGLLLASLLRLIERGLCSWNIQGR